MHCKYCGFNNGPEDHRCHRCGRRIGVAMAAPAGYSGANALAVQPALDPNSTQDLAPAEAESTAQSTLFASPTPKVIQFPAPPAGKAMWIPAVAPPVVPPPAKKTAPQQTTLDFLESAPPQRTLRGEVPAQIYCE